MYPYKEKLRKLIDHRDPRKKIKEGSFLDRSEIVPEGNLVEESFFFFYKSGDSPSPSEASTHQIWLESQSIIEGDELFGLLGLSRPV